MAEFGTFTSGSVLTANELNAAGAWTSFTPSWTGLTPSNGFVSAQYSQFNKILFVRVFFTFGTTTSMGDPVRMTLPASLTQTTNQEIVGWAQYTDTGIASYPGYVSVSSSTQVTLGVINTAGTYSTSNNVNNARPFVFAYTDSVVFEFTTRLA